MMGANISLAFRWHAAIEDLSVLEQTLGSFGLTLDERGQLDEGTSTATWTWRIRGEACTVTCRSYDRAPQVATTLDVEESRFDAMAERIGRPAVIQSFIALGVHLLTRLGLAYVFFEQEAEADLDPGTYCGDVLFGITILPAAAPWLDRAVAADDIQRVEQLDGAIVVLRRLDPAPERG